MREQSVPDHHAPRLGWDRLGLCQESCQLGVDSYLMTTVLLLQAAVFRHHLMAQSFKSFDKSRPFIDYADCTTGSKRPRVKTAMDYLQIGVSSE